MIRLYLQGQRVPRDILTHETDADIRFGGLITVFINKRGWAFLGNSFFYTKFYAGHLDVDCNYHCFNGRFLKPGGGVGILIKMGDG